MTAHLTQQAEYAQPKHTHTYSRVSSALNILQATLLSSLLVYLLSGCSLSSTTTTSNQSTTPPPQRQLTYVAIGASDTFGFGTSDPYNQNWATDLAGKLGPRYRLINLGIPSMHVQDALTSELPVALDAHPNLVTIWLAVNDLADHVP